MADKYGTGSDLFKSRITIKPVEFKRPVDPRLNSNAVPSPYSGAGAAGNQRTVPSPYSGSGAAGNQKAAPNPYSGSGIQANPTAAPNPHTGSGMPSKTRAESETTASAREPFIPEFKELTREEYLGLSDQQRMQVDANTTLRDALKKDKVDLNRINLGSFKGKETSKLLDSLGEFGYQRNQQTNAELDRLGGFTSMENMQGNRDISSLARALGKRDRAGFLRSEMPDDAKLQLQHDAYADMYRQYQSMGVEAPLNNRKEFEKTIQAWVDQTEGALVPDFAEWQRYIRARLKEG